ncbi:MAG: hypothetical protein H6828_10770 [Planctomycetes bacterium]|nr:hypothetical protein [Planctomycetota bacterium]
MTTSAFARKRGIPPWRLYNALRSRTHKSKRRAQTSALLPVIVKDTPPRQSAPLELKLSGGHSLVIPADFDEASLRRLMGVLSAC